MDCSVLDSHIDIDLCCNVVTYSNNGGLDISAFSSMDVDAELQD